MEKFLEKLREISRIGRDGNGITRLAFSKEFFQAQAELRELMEGLGLKTHVDGVGNLIARLEGKTRDTICLGSHLDTVRNGGELDGFYGVAAGLIVAKLIKENKLDLKNSLEIIAFNSEESNELGGTFGSRAMAGELELDLDLEAKLEKYGLDLDDVRSSRRDLRDIRYFLEIHIEQGDILDSNKEEIGIVTGIVGINTYEIKVKGVVNHAGTTSMANRKDALLEAALLIIEINKIVKTYNNQVVGTVGMVQNKPNSINIIPGETSLSLDIRSISKEKLDEAVSKIREYIMTRKNVEFEFKNVSIIESVETSSEINKITEKICRENAYSYRYMTSGAGHDAETMLKHVDGSMIFVPSVAGLSHCKEEFTRQEDLEKGVRTLYELVLSLDRL